MITKTKLVILLVFLNLYTTYAQDALEFNRQGFFAYEQQDYRRAYDLFKRAVEMDPDLAVAHYNKACMLSLCLDDWGKYFPEYAGPYRYLLLSEIEKALGPL
jgi:lipoprotein NlpI